jgi:hypothetical protein
MGHRQVSQASDDRCPRVAARCAPAVEHFAGFDVDLEQVRLAHALAAFVGPDDGGLGPQPAKSPAAQMITKRAAKMKAPITRPRAVQ